jgi:hypothetical protein
LPGTDTSHEGRFPAAKSVGASDNEAMAMTEEEWLACSDPQPMLQRIQQSGLASRRKQWLFTAACLDRLSPLLLYNGLREAIGVLERVADGSAREEEWSAAITATGNAADAARTDFENISDPYSRSVDSIAAARDAAIAVHASIENADPYYVAFHAASAYSRWFNGGTASWQAERSLQATLLRDIFGTLPFRPVTLNPAWLNLGGSVRCHHRPLFQVANWPLARYCWQRCRPIRASALSLRGTLLSVVQGRPAVRCC